MKNLIVFTFLGLSALSLVAFTGGEHARVERDQSAVAPVNELTVADVQAQHRDYPIYPVKK